MIRKIRGRYTPGGYKATPEVFAIIDKIGAELAAELMERFGPDLKPEVDFAGTFCHRMIGLTVDVIAKYAPALRRELPGIAHLDDTDLMPQALEALSLATLSERGRPSLIVISVKQAIHETLRAALR